MQSHTLVSILPDKKRLASLVSLITALTMLLSLGLSGIAAPMAAFAAGADQEKAEYLAIRKLVTESELIPGDEFTYTVSITCSQDDCVNAVAVDQLPSELNQFDVVDFAVVGSQKAQPRTVWTVDGVEQDSRPAVLTADTKFEVYALDPLQLYPGESGLASGSTMNINLTLKVPANYPPGKSGVITNTAVTRGDNAIEVSASADVEIDSPVIVDGQTTKSWAPATQSFDPGAQSVISVGLKNASNVAVSKMVL